MTSEALRRILVTKEAFPDGGEVRDYVKSNDTIISDGHIELDTGGGHCKPDKDDIGH